MVTKPELHALVEQLSDDEVAAVERYLRRLRDDPFLAMLEAAPDDDEPVTEDDLATIEAARREHAAGKTIPWDEVRRELLSD